jgi:hypothetical protein
MVGSYSSMKRDRINDMVTADLPTPPSPRTCILMTLFSAPIAEPKVPIEGDLHVFVKMAWKWSPVDRYCGDANVRGILQSATSNSSRLQLRARHTLVEGNCWSVWVSGK